MRNLLNAIILVLCFVAFSGSAQKSNGAFSGIASKGSLTQPITLAGGVLDLPAHQPLDCTIRVDITLSDGTTVTGEITIVDISWWDCTKVKVGNFLSKVF